VPDALDAALRQLAGHGEHLAALDAREAEHFGQIAERLAQLGKVVTGLGPDAHDRSAILDRLHALDDQVAALATRLTGAGPDGGGPGAGEGEGYRPSPAPRWWKPRGTGRDDAVAKLAGWVEQVYRPGYGQLSATLGSCWANHPLCLYALDIAAELWSVLYLQPARTPGVLSAQAEYHARILPALAEQMMIETTRCGHAQQRATANGTTTAPVRRP
jgi:hypothetical protein